MANLDGAALARALTCMPVVRTQLRCGVVIFFDLGLTPTIRSSRRPLRAFLFPTQFAFGGNSEISLALLGVPA
jgi:hypothetical protein